MDLVDLLKQCSEMMHAQFDRMGHRLVLDLPERAVYADIDPTRISQAINNLLSNASKFTENGGRVRLSLGLEREQAVISVQDNGHGIAPEQLKTIFEMFVQLDGSGESRTEGLGIGLSLAKQLVELHGGSIAAYSEGCGKGAEFVIRLPLPDDQKQAADARFPSNLSHAGVGTFAGAASSLPHSMRAEYQGHAVSLALRISLDMKTDDKALGLLQMGPAGNTTKVTSAKKLKVVSDRTVARSLMRRDISKVKPFVFAARLRRIIRWSESMTLLWDSAPATSCATGAVQSLWPRLTRSSSRILPARA